jgi:hypothetical protein
MTVGNKEVVGIGEISKVGLGLGKRDVRGFPAHPINNMRATKPKAEDLDVKTGFRIG